MRLLSFIAESIYLSCGINRLDFIIFEQINTFACVFICCSIIITKVAICEYSTKQQSEQYVSANCLISVLQGVGDEVCFDMEPRLAL